MENRLKNENIALVSIYIYKLIFALVPKWHPTWKGASDLELPPGFDQYILAQVLKDSVWEDRGTLGNIRED